MKDNTNMGASADRDQASKTSPDIDKNYQQAKSRVQSDPRNRSDMNADKTTGVDKDKNNAGFSMENESDDDNSSEESDSQQSGTNAQGSTPRSLGQSSSQNKNSPSDFSKEQRK